MATAIPGDGTNEGRESGEPASAESDPASVPWIVQAWRERGLISGEKSIATTSELLAANSTSWFVRRNKRPPPHRAVSMASNAAAQEQSDPGFATIWLERRNRHCGSGRAAPSAAPLAALRRQSSLLGQAIQSRLPQGVRPLRAEPAKCKISPATSRDDGELFDLAPTASAAARPADSSHDPADDEMPHVYLTVYDLSAPCNTCCAHWLGLGVYHSGILIQGVEYTFDNIASFNGSGVIAHEPYYDDVERGATLPLRCKILLGRSQLPARAAHAILSRLAPLWPAGSYDVLEHNCHHWSMEAAQRLGVQPLPYWVCRSTEVLRFFSGIDTSSSADGDRPPTVHRCIADGGQKASRPMSMLKMRDKYSPRDGDGRREAFGDDDEGCEPLIRSESSRSLSEADDSRA